MSRPIPYLNSRRLPGRFLEENEGSFTMEATIVFPVFFGMLLLFLIVAFYVFQQGVLYTAAVRTTETAAFHWDNSKRDATRPASSWPG